MEEKIFLIDMAYDQQFKADLYELIKQQDLSEANKNVLFGRVKNQEYDRLLRQSAAYGLIDIVKYLLADEYFQTNINGYAIKGSGKSALHVAAEKGHREIVQEILHHQVFVNAVDNSGCTATYYAMNNGHYRIVCDLLKKDGVIVCDPSNKIDTRLMPKEGMSQKELNNIVQFLNRRQQSYSQRPQPDTNYWCCVLKFMTPAIYLSNIDKRMPNIGPCSSILRWAVDIGFPTLNLKRLIKLTNQYKVLHYKNMTYTAMDLKYPTSVALPIAQHDLEKLQQLFKIKDQQERSEIKFSFLIKPVPAEEVTQDNVIQYQLQFKTDVSQQREGIGYTWQHQFPDDTLTLCESSSTVVIDCQNFGDAHLEYIRSTLMNQSNSHSANSC